MTHTAPAPRIEREFDRFLFSAIGDDRHGQPLSVLSALARSDVDPWEEAAGLAHMSPNGATARLTGLIAALPGEPIADRPLDAIAGDLIALLPRTNTFASPSPPERPTALLSENARAGLALGALAILTAFALLIAPSRSNGPQQGAGFPASFENVWAGPLPLDFRR